MHTERNELRKKLKWGDITKIAEIADVNRKTVERWFDGESDNQVVEETVKQFLSARKKSIANKIATFL